MNMPGFTAETSLYTTSGSYRVLAAQANYAGAPMAFPQQLSPRMATNVSCTGTNGDECYCPTGCKKRTNGTCCCTIDKECGNKFSDVFSGGGVFSY
jgi:hypothetical protein